MMSRFLQNNYSLVIPGACFFNETLVSCALTPQACTNGTFFSSHEDCPASVITDLGVRGYCPGHDICTTDQFSCPMSAENINEFTLNEACTVASNRDTSADTLYAACYLIEEGIEEAFGVFDPMDCPQDGEWTRVNAVDAEAELGVAMTCNKVMTGACRYENDYQCAVAETACDETGSFVSVIDLFDVQDIACYLCDDSDVTPVEEGDDLQVQRNEGVNTSASVLDDENAHENVTATDTEDVYGVVEDIPGNVTVDELDGNATAAPDDIIIDVGVNETNDTLVDTTSEQLLGDGDPDLNPGNDTHDVVAVEIGSAENGTDTTLDGSDVVDDDVVGDDDEDDDDDVVGDDDDVVDDDDDDDVVVDDDDKSFKIITEGTDATSPDTQVDDDGTDDMVDFDTTKDGSNIEAIDGSDATPTGAESTIAAEHPEVEPATKTTRGHMYFLGFGLVASVLYVSIRSRRQRRKVIKYSPVLTPRNHRRAVGYV